MYQVQIIVTENIAFNNNQTSFFVPGGKALRDIKKLLTKENTQFTVRKRRQQRRRRNNVYK